MISDKKRKSKNILPAAYDASNYEQTIYTAWERSGFFNPDICVESNVVKKSADPFTVMMPPPNVTGILHLGHALEQSIMDTRVRFERMRGKKTLWVPGTDHAAVATQARVEKDLVEKGIKDPRKELGREKLLNEIRLYAARSKKTILQQIKRMGSSCDWSRLAYTFDEQRTKAVNSMFKRMYDDGLIYRGYRVVNWSVVGQCTTSDDELVYVERPAKLYTFFYSKDFPIPIATTRPETKLGDTAVAVHPHDARYKKYIGKTYTVDIGAKKPLSIKIIGDKTVDAKFGTGALGVTPAHSVVDFEMKERHDLELIEVIGFDGRMTENAGAYYKGLIVEKAREKFVQWLSAHELLVSTEDITQNVATSDRFNDVIEVIPMTQWFVAVNKTIGKTNKTLKDLMRDAVTKGHKGIASQKVTIHPERFEKVYFNWIDNLRDWCISRQIWWGHRIPVWYGKDGSVVVSEKSPGSGYVQDEDTLDTWFSSGTWTFSTLGWPNTQKGKKKTGDLATYHPTSWMQMGYEILFFWMARMILMSTFVLDEIPFKDVYIHGLVRDKDGKKFSKSLRNTLDPITMIDRYGTDALRMSLLSNVSAGNDLRFYEEKVEHYQHFVNKLWNISRYIYSSVSTIFIPDKQPIPFTDSDAWILKRLDSLVGSLTKDLNDSMFSVAAARYYQFVWFDFADWYIEVAKIERRRSEKEKKNKDTILLHVLHTVLRLGHPFMPFVTETLWKQFSRDNFLMVSAWPHVQRTEDVKAGVIFSKIQRIIVTIREYRSTHNIPAAQIVTVRMKLPHPEYTDVIEKLARCTIEGARSNTIIVESKSILTDTKRSELEQYVRRLEKKLSDQAFIKNAPSHIVDQERKKLSDAKKQLS